MRSCCTIHRSTASFLYFLSSMKIPKTDNNFRGASLAFPFHLSFQLLSLSVCPVSGLSLSLSLSLSFCTPPLASLTLLPAELARSISTPSQSQASPCLHVSLRSFFLSLKLFMISSDDETVRFLSRSSRAAHTLRLGLRNAFFLPSSLSLFKTGRQPPP